MSLVRVLAAVASLADLPALVAALGHEPLWDELDPRAWAGGLRLVRVPLRVAVAGRAGSMPWYAIEAEDAERSAAAAARRLARHAQPAGVLALEPAGRRLTLAIAWAECPVLSLDLDQPGRVALAALARVHGLRTRGAVATAHGIAGALSAEGLGRRFFEQFRLTLDRFAAAVSGPPDAAARRALALVQLTRVLFLYFVQAKGWLDRDEAFLARQVDRCLLHRRSLHRHVFQPLFFGTLDRPAPLRSHAARAFGRVPFLNGGLFEPHPLEQRWPVAVPNTAWRDAFDELFEHFIFTVDERAPVGAIAPDMLGQVFEGVMSPDRRRASGTYYTPAALVRRVIDAALRALVASRLGISEERAEALLVRADAPALNVLRAAAVLDPAVGSGAFLLGALERLAAFREGTAPDAVLRRDILRRNLFGVDLDAGAVRLAELRLWLAVVADDSTTDPMRVQPLPNLDCLIRQGDSLADPIPGGQLASVDPERAHEIGRLRRLAVLSSGSEKRSSVRNLRRLELAAVRESLRAREASAERRVAEALEAARAPTLFGERRALDAAARRGLGELRRALQEARRVRRRAERNDELPWFHFEAQFADVFARGGFDLVVGNPPWVRAETLPPAARTQLSARYRWWRSARGRGYAHQPDLALAFVERAWELTSPGGVVALLVPAKLATAGYGAVAREVLARAATICASADLTSDTAAVFEATAYPHALVLAKRSPPSGHRVRGGLHLDSSAGPRQDQLAGGAPWVITADPVRAAVAALRERFPAVGDTWRAQLGAKTGANAVFLDPAAELEPELMRWAVRGRDVRPFTVLRRTRILWTHGPDGSPLAALPPRAAAWIDRHRAVLRARADYRGGPEWTLFRTMAASAPHRVVWPDLARQLTAAALPASAPLVPLNTCYVAAVPSRDAAHALAGWLNTTWMRAVARLDAMPAASGFARFSGSVIDRLPLPPAAVGNPVLAAQARAARSDGSQVALDALAAELLELPTRARRALAESAGVLHAGV